MPLSIIDILWLGSFAVPNSRVVGYNNLSLSVKSILIYPLLYELIVVLASDAHGL